MVWFCMVAAHGPPRACGCGTVSRKITDPRAWRNGPRADRGHRPRFARPLQKSAPNCDENTIIQRRVYRCDGDHGFVELTGAPRSPTVQPGVVARATATGRNGMLDDGGEKGATAIIRIAFAVACLAAAGLVAAPSPATADELDVLYARILTNPRDVEANLAYARAAEARGELRKALTTYERVLLLDPGQAEASEGLWRIRRLLEPASTTVVMEAGVGYESNPTEQSQAALLRGQRLRLRRRAAARRAPPRRPALAHRRARLRRLVSGRRHHQQRRRGGERRPGAAGRRQRLHHPPGRRRRAGVARPELPLWRGRRQPDLRGPLRRRHAGGRAARCLARLRRPLGVRQRPG